VTLSGDTNDTFVINVTGRFMLTRGSKIVGAGVPASAILYNIIGDGQQVAMTGKTRIDGTVLALELDIAVTPGIVNGEVIPILR
jgi:choice-of-anchor A domain-containing protein